MPLQFLNTQIKYKTATAEWKSLYKQAQQCLKNVQLFHDKQYKMKKQEKLLIELHEQILVCSEEDK